MYILQRKEARKDAEYKLGALLTEFPKITWNIFHSTSFQTEHMIYAILNDNNQFLILIFFELACFIFLFA